MVNVGHLSRLPAAIFKNLQQLISAAPLGVKEAKEDYLKTIQDLRLKMEASLF